MSDYLDNPAGRLLALLELARKTTQNAVAAQQWSTVFGVDQLSPQFFRAIANVVKMAADARVQMKEVEPELHEIHLEHFGQVDEAISAFTRCSAITMADFLVPLDERSGLHSLKVCSAILHSKKPEGRLSDDERDSLLEQVLSLIEEVENSGDLEAEVRGWLLDRLCEIRIVLERPVQFGIKDLAAVNDAIVGGLQTKRLRISVIAKSGVAKKVLGLIIALDLAVNLGANSLQIAQGVSGAPQPTPVVVQIQQNIEQYQIGSSNGVQQLPAGRDAAPKGELDSAGN
jgi:hypothetical protein